MAITTEDWPSQTENPLDMIEDRIFGDSWPCERTSEDEIVVSVKGNWCDYQISITWKQEMETLHFACAFDANIAKVGLGTARRQQVYTLLGMINAQLLLGHFDLWQEESALVFRHAAFLHGGRTGPEQCECLLQIAIETCERFYPAFQFVLWAGKEPQEALNASLFETVGEA